jgi:hypothetical protein
MKARTSDSIVRVSQAIVRGRYRNARLSTPTVSTRSVNVRMRYLIVCGR